VSILINNKKHRTEEQIREAVYKVSGGKSMDSMLALAQEATIQVLLWQEVTLNLAKSERSSFKITKVKEKRTADEIIKDVNAACRDYWEETDGIADAAQKMLVQTLIWQETAPNESGKWADLAHEQMQKLNEMPQDIEITVTDYHLSRCCERHTLVTPKDIIDDLIYPSFYLLHPWDAVEIDRYIAEFKLKSEMHRRKED